MSAELAVEVQHAGFGLRLLAGVLDAMFLIAGFVVIYYATTFLLVIVAIGAPSRGALAGAVIPAIAVAFQYVGLPIVGPWLYYVLLERSRWRATPGKMIVGLQVVGTRAQRVGFWRAAARNAAKCLTAASLMTGFLFAAFTPRRQALHDLLARTLVIRERPDQTAALASGSRAGFWLGLGCCSPSPARCWHTSGLRTYTR